MAQAIHEQNRAVADEYEAFTKSITSSGNFLDGDPFMPTTTATTVAASGTTGGSAVTTSPQLIAYLQGRGRRPRAGRRRCAWPFRGGVRPCAVPKG